jgi:transposase
MKAVKAVQEGMKQKEACRIFGISRSGLNNWLSSCRSKGIESLKARDRGRPKGQTQLSAQQVKEVKRLIVDRMPDQLNLPFMLWTRQAVAELVKRRYGVQVSRFTMGRWLKQWGLTPQKPLRRALQQNPELVQQWLAVEYPQIQREAKKDKAEIHWGDEMGLRSDHQAGTSYALKGKTPVISVTGQRWQFNMISTITNRGRLRWMFYKGGFTSAVFLKFLGRLLKGSRSKVYLIVDGHPVHKSQAVEKWLKERSKRIRLIFLPAYSPELNPDEYLNNDIKANAVGRLRAINQEEMMDNVDSYLAATKKYPELVRRYFHAPPVQYAM